MTEQVVLMQKTFIKSGLFNFASEIFYVLKINDDPFVIGNRKIKGSAIVNRLKHLFHKKQIKYTL